MLWTETVFSACLARHWPDHHWQCNWRVAWASLRICAGKRRTIQATTVTIFSQYDKKRFSYVKRDTIFTLCCFVNYHKFKQLTFARHCAIAYWRYGGKYYMYFAGNLLLSRSEIILKICSKKYVFKQEQKTGSDGICCGRLFKIRTAATGKAWSP